MVRKKFLKNFWNPCPKIPGYGSGNDICVNLQNSDF